MPTIITRERSTGKLKLNGAFAALRGSTYDLLFNPAGAEKAVVDVPGGQTHLVPYDQGEDPCQAMDDKGAAVKYAPWDNANDFAELFGTLTGNHCNFVRVFLFGGTLFGTDGPVSLSPFNRVKTPSGAYRYDVRGAALQGRWNTAYFDRLRSFVEAADRAGVVVQLSVFNYDDLGADETAKVKKWSLSPWNAGNSLDQAWGSTHLLPAGASPSDRQTWFVSPPQSIIGLRAVQQEVIGHVMQTLTGLQNVILEVMNEPHPFSRTDADLARIAEFDSYMTRLITLYRRNLGVQVLISINATIKFDAQNLVIPDRTDLDAWKDDPRISGNLGEVDVVSYHGLTAMRNDIVYTVCTNRQVRPPRVDRASVAALHAGSVPDKAILFSTDAVLFPPFVHAYAGGVQMELRDGQIQVLPEIGQKGQLIHSGVYEWALRCFQQGSGTNLGKTHFHSHSLYRAAIEETGRAAVDAGFTAAAAAPEPAQPVSV